MGACENLCNCTELVVSNPLTAMFFHVSIMVTTPSGLCGNTRTLEGVLFFEVISVAEKEFRKISEQIELLKSRGLHIPDEEEASLFLLRNNYYRVSGYSLTLRKHDVFYCNATFRNIMDIYCFDHELRHLLLHFIECIEVSIKSIYSYEFAKVYGPTAYLDATHFIDAVQHANTLRKTDEQKNKRHAHEAYLKHFIDDLKEDIPLWAYVDLMTISDISLIYKISEDSVKKAVAAHYGLTMNAGHEILGRFMHSMTIIRNLCAHGGRLFNRLFEQKPSLNKKEQALLIRNCEGIIDNAHLYGFVFIMKRLLTSDEFLMFKERLTELAKKYPFVSLKYYGFREDWQDKL